MAAAAAADYDCLRPRGERNVVKEVVKRIMFLDHSKKPFKFNDMLATLHPKPTRRKWPEILTEAKNCLKNMGLILHETKHTPQKMFFVTSQAQPLETMYKYASEEEVSDRILLTFVLTFIFMKNGAVASDRLFSHLQLLGIYNESKPAHPYFGNVKKKVMSEFTEKFYLSIIKIAVDQDLFEVKWGQRAECELSKRAVLEFICTQGFGGKIKPQEYTSHYEQVLAQEKRWNGEEEEEQQPQEVMMPEDNEEDYEVHGVVVRRGA